jgi:hypothetical protein
MAKNGYHLHQKKYVLVLESLMPSSVLLSIQHLWNSLAKVQSSSHLPTTPLPILKHIQQHKLSHFLLWRPHSQAGCWYVGGSLVNCFGDSRRLVHDKITFQNAYGHGTAHSKDGNEGAACSPQPRTHLPLSHQLLAFIQAS